MSTAALKLTSLAIRTLAKPIATRLKHQAREHPSFRRMCIGIAQQMHRFDMRLRLGLLQDPVAIAKAEKAERERRHAEAIKRMQAAQAEMEAIYPGMMATVRSDVLSPEALEEAAKRAEKEAADALKEAGAHKTVHRIRPLSESKAIDAGANFISEAFLFAVAGGLILFEALRARKKEANRRDIVAERLQLLEDRNRQDEERLDELERKEQEDVERMWRLEVEIWKLKGEKGDMPMLKLGARREWEKKPLWVEEKKGDRWFAGLSNWLGLGNVGGDADEEKGEIVMVRSNGAEEKKDAGIPDMEKAASAQDMKVAGKELVLTRQAERK